VLFPGLPTVHFWPLRVFNVLEAVKNWTMGRLGNDTTANQACSNLVPPPTTEQYHRFVASNRYTAIAQTQSSLSCYLAFTCVTYAPKPHWSRLQTTSQKWFINRFTSRLLNRFSVFTPGVSKRVQRNQHGNCTCKRSFSCKLDWETRYRWCFTIGTVGVQTRKTTCVVYTYVPITFWQLHLLDVA